MSAKESPDYYQLLGIIRTANADQIRSAFHRFARKHHPDNFVGSPEEAERHTDLYQHASEAYRVLLDPTKRKLYDEGLERGVVRYSEDRAKETRRTMRPPGGVVLRSSKARVFFTRAHRAMKAEDWPQAKLNLQMAIQNEPDNVELEAKLEEVLQRIKSG
ncbi:MAG: J domain-containing protein [Deltaproteobacteria bacterium]|nr:MAG: J domain-containing protein [Deltaproteobacteria bacterium]UCF48839.1 MAG: J domain-containing protein [Myxococcales bacterium]